jgi:hypothetical protein
MGLLASSVHAQRPSYGWQGQHPVVNRGGYQVATGSPYYTPASSSAVYYQPGYSFAYYGRGFPPAGYTPQAEARAYAATQYYPFSSSNYTPRFSNYPVVTQYYFGGGGPVSYGP